MTARPDSGVRRVGIVPVALAALATAPVSAQAWRPLVEDLGDPTRSEAAERELIALGPGALPALQAVIEDANLGDQRERARFVAAMRVIDLLGSQVSDVQKSLGAPFLAPNGGNIRRGNIAYPLVEVLQALGSTTPYAGDIQFHNLFHLSVVWSNGKDKAATMRLIYRYQIRHDCKVGSAARAREVLAADRLFEREVAAEFLGVAGQPEDAALLRDRLLRRTPAAEGTAALRHNGFPVTCDDDFAFRAARALTRLAPDDKVSAIGYALLAVHHPHRSSRLEALQQLARFGPAIENAIPELMTVARGDDAELAAEALKLVGMGGRAAGGQLAAVDALTAHADPRVQRRAVTLAKMLRAMGHEAAEIDPAADAAAGARRELAAAVAALADGDADSDDVAAAERAIAAEPDAAFPLLVERFRTEFHDCPDRVVAWLARLGIARPEAERAMLCDALATSGERWAGPSFSSHSGGTSPTEAWKRAYGCLAIGASQSPGELRGFLTDDNSALRLAAAARLAAHPDRVAAAADAELETQLWQAVTADHPAKSKFRYGRNGTADFPTDYQAEIGADAALALLATEQLPDRHGTLLHAALAAPDHSRRNAVGGEIPRAALLARAIARWGAGASAADLRDAAQDDRPEVAEAARQALAARDGR